MLQSVARINGQPTKIRKNNKCESSLLILFPILFSKFPAIGIHAFLPGSPLRFLCRRLPFHIGFVFPFKIIVRHSVSFRFYPVLKGPSAFSRVIPRYCFAVSLFCRRKPECHSILSPCRSRSGFRAASSGMSWPAHPCNPLLSFFLRPYRIFCH